MKTLNIIPLLIGLLTVTTIRLGFAGDGKYEQAMKKNIETVYHVKAPNEIQEAVNSFERIALAEKDHWEPSYYAAFGYIMLSEQEKEGAKKDAYLDQALASIGKARKIAPSESEIEAIEGFVHMMRVSIDPATRGPQYSGLAMQLFGKAVALNPENPRALLFTALMQQGMAKFFGSPVTEACGTLTKALEKFDSFKSENALAPTWGKGIAENMKKGCQ
jgi:tetratricopeptide (TPR) repeat protein